MCIYMYIDVLQHGSAQPFRRQPHALNTHTQPHTNTPAPRLPHTHNHTQTHLLPGFCLLLASRLAPPTAAALTNGGCPRPPVAALTRKGKPESQTHRHQTRPHANTNTTIAPRHEHKEILLESQLT